MSEESEYMEFCYFVYGCPVVLALAIEKHEFSLMNCFCTFVKSKKLKINEKKVKYLYLCGFIYSVSVPFGLYVYPFTSPELINMVL